MHKVLLLIFIVTSLSYSQNYFNWERHYLPWEIKNIIPFSENNIIGYDLSTTQKKLYRTENGGEDWIEMTTILVGGKLKALQKIGSRLFFLGIDNNQKALLYYSDNLGVNRTKVDLSVTGEITKLYEVHDEVFAYVQKSQELLISSDLGVSWSNYLNLPAETNSVEISTNGVIYIHVGTEIKRFDGFPDNWSNIYVQEPVFSGEICAIEDSLLLLYNGDKHNYSIDRGENWGGNILPYENPEIRKNGNLGF